MKQPPPSKQSRKLFDFLACLLIILSHFANYIIYAGYSRLFPDIVVVVGILCAVALGLTALLQVPSRTMRALVFAILITIVISDALYEFGVADVTTRLVALAATLLFALALVFFLRDHTSQVLIGAFLAMLLATIVIATIDSTDPVVSADGPPQMGDDARPIVVHLILDEHMGLAGMTKALPGGENIRGELEEFYERAGFRLFSRAYSQYFETAPSLAAMMNFSESHIGKPSLMGKRYGYLLRMNAYLKKLSDLNYRINIYQSNYIDFCHTSGIRIVECSIYKPDNLKSSELWKLPVAERVKLIFNMYYSSFTLIKLLKLVEQPVISWFREWGINLKGFGLWHGRVGPLAVAPSFEQLVEDISRSKGGTIFFAHLLIPHYPYVYATHCEVRAPISSWGLRRLNNGTNTLASRKQSYGEYFDQIRCLNRKLERLFDAMKRAGTYEKSIIVIHGDHGARINLSTPLATNRQQHSVMDYVDGFSTLFAFKAPGVVAGLDPRMLSLSRLLKYAASRDEKHLSTLSFPTIYLYKDEFDYIKAPLPDFPGRSR